jgi:hypothetical protein
MPTKQAPTPRKRRTLPCARDPRPAINPDSNRPIPENVHLYAMNIVRRMWPSLYEAVSSERDHAASPPAPPAAGTAPPA